MLYIVLQNNVIGVFLKIAKMIYLSLKLWKSAFKQEAFKIAFICTYRDFAK